MFCHSPSAINLKTILAHFGRLGNINDFIVKTCPFFGLDKITLFMSLLPILYMTKVNFLGRSGSMPEMEEELLDSKKTPRKGST
jgi:hypothetical protein